MTTWTPATEQAETWTNQTPGRFVFSSLVFSQASLNGLHVFAFSNASEGAEGWYSQSVDAESWTAA